MPEAVVGAVVALCASLIVALMSWALKRLAAARDREMEAVATLAEVRTRLGALAETLERLDERIDDQEEAQRTHSAQVHQDIRQLSTELAEVRAVLDTHIDWERRSEQASS